MSTEPVEVVRRMFAAYLAQDLAAADDLVAPDMRFTSPQDDHIDRATYFERCFPTAARLRWQELRQIADAGDGGVLVRYEYELTTGERHRNCEFITVTDGAITEVEVYFGGAVDPAAGVTGACGG